LCPCGHGIASIFLLPTSKLVGIPEKGIKKWDGKETEFLEETRFLTGL
jgi:hypothetical protein